MKKLLVPALCLGLTTLCPVFPAIAQTTPPAFDPQTFRLQVLLDRAAFSPGVIDGKPGQSLDLALKGFQQARDLPETGKPDPATLDALGASRAPSPLQSIMLSATDLAGPFTGKRPKDLGEQSKLASLGYVNIIEKLAEQYHTTPATIVRLNRGNPPLRVGTKLWVPNTTPSSREYDPELSEEWRTTLTSLNISAQQPEGKRIVVDKSESVLRVFDARDRLVAQFPATMGSEHDPLPLGRWKVLGKSYNPKFHYNPDLFWDAKSKDEKAMLPPGPNSPVGVIWIDINKPHYGIHGTPSPEKIGRTESHGCIRLTNWDAARLTQMIGGGTPAVFQQ